MGPERGDDYHFGAGGYEFAERFGEGQIPADEEADGAEGSGYRYVWGRGRGG